MANARQAAELTGSRGVARGRRSHQCRHGAAATRYRPSQTLPGRAGHRTGCNGSRLAHQQPTRTQAAPPADLDAATVDARGRPWRPARRHGLTGKRRPDRLRSRGRQPPTQRSARRQHGVSLRVDLRAAGPSSRAVAAIRFGRCRTLPPPRCQQRKPARSSRSPAADAHGSCADRCWSGPPPAINPAAATTWRRRRGSNGSNGRSSRMSSVSTSAAMPARPSGPLPRR